VAAARTLPLRPSILAATLVVHRWHGTHFICITIQQAQKHISSTKTLGQLPKSRDMLCRCASGITQQHSLPDDFHSYGRRYIARHALASVTEEWGVVHAWCDGTKDGYISCCESGYARMEQEGTWDATFPFGKWTDW
jgi:hypothetical protein